MPIGNRLFAYAIIRYVYSPHNMYAGRRFGNKRDFQRQALCVRLSKSILKATLDMIHLLLFDPSR